LQLFRADGRVQNPTSIRRPSNLRGTGMPQLSTDLRARVIGFGNLLAAKRTACTNEESTKLFLILPFLAVLGYDPLNPYEVYPEHAATFDPTTANKVDFAVLRDGVPVIAIE
jgi:predicted type IV restriction endonuclease